jgi:dTDP-4-dehydrorhamnose reductase
MDHSIKVLITGGTGLLGKTLLETLPPQVTPFATYHSAPLPDSSVGEFLPLDVRRQSEVDKLVANVQPDVVVHAASIGSVDYTEKHPQETRTVNVQGTQYIVDACRQHRARIVFISSNAVFDGQNPPYDEQAPTNSVNYYGKLKIEGEQVVRQSGIPFVIIRPILMYGWPNPDRRANPVTWWVNSLEQGKPLKIVDDVYSKPLLAKNCAEACWAAILQERTGIYHVAGRDHVTLYEFALETARVFDLDESLITPVPSSYFPNIAPRPKDTSFTTRKMEQELGVLPIGIKDGLRYMKLHCSKE